LELLVEGLSDREIAVRLCISPHTAATHVKRVREKFGVGSRSAVVARAINAGIVPSRSPAVPVLHHPGNGNRNGDGNGHGARTPLAAPVGPKR
jgi:hypothetical protein